MGIVTPKYYGRVGNQLFQYVYSRLLAEKNGFSMGGGFPVSSCMMMVEPYPDVCFPSYSGVELKDMFWYNQTPKYLEQYLHELFPGEERFITDGYWQDPRYYAPYRCRIRSWFSFPDVDWRPELDAIVAHVRLGDYVSLKTVVAPQWISKVLYTVGYRPQRQKLYIVTDEPDSPYFDKLKQYRPEIVSRSVEEDWNFIRAAKRIICGNSSFSWWAAYLSDADYVYSFPSWMRNNPWINLAYAENWKPIEGNFWKS